MRYRCLGRSGLRVAELCLGTMTFGSEQGWGADKAESKRIFDAYVEAGGNFVDTANVYGQGASEEYVGDFIAGSRGSIVLATKYTIAPPRGEPNSGGNQRKNLVQSLEASLRRLRTHYVDLYTVHAWDAITPVEELMRALDDQVRAGKVLYAGISNAPAWVVAQANTLAEYRGWSPFVALQVEYSLVERAVERELLPMAQAFDIAVTAWSPLAAGVLTGKYNQTGKQQGGQRRLDISKARKVDDRSLAIAGEVVSVAQAGRHTPTQTALAWLRHQGAIPILGARNVDQIKDALGATEVTLSPDELARLDTVSKIELGYPHDFLARENVRGSVYCGTRELIDNPRLM